MTAANVRTAAAAVMCLCCTCVAAWQQAPMTGMQMSRALLRHRHPTCGVSGMKNAATFTEAPSKSPRVSSLTVPVEATEIKKPMLKEHEPLIGQRCDFVESAQLLVFHVLVVRPATKNTCLLLRALYDRRVRAECLWGGEKTKITSKPARK